MVRRASWLLTEKMTTPWTNPECAKLHPGGPMQLLLEFVITVGKGLP